MKTLDYDNHVASLAIQHGVSIVWKNGTSGRAWRKSRKVRLSPIRSAISYAVALHELGHVVGEQNGNRLNKEYLAWKWAKENAIDWRKPMKKTCSRCLSSYVQWCQRRKGAWIPPSDHPVWKMAEA